MTPEERAEHILYDALYQSLAPSLPRPGLVDLALFVEILLRMCVRECMRALQDGDAGHSAIIYRATLRFIQQVVALMEEHRGALG